MIVNLLPVRTETLINFRSTLRFWLRLSLSLWMIISIYLYFPYRAVLTQRNQLQKLEHRCEPVYQLQADIAKTRQQIRTLRLEHSRLQKLEQEDPLPALFQSVLIASEPFAGQLQLQRAQLVFDPRPASGNTRSPKSGSGGAASKPAVTIATISLYGLTQDENILAGFVETMREMNLIDRVELKSSNNLQFGSNIALQFQLECRTEL